LRVRRNHPPCEENKPKKEMYRQEEKRNNKWSKESKYGAKKKAQRNLPQERVQMKEGPWAKTGVLLIKNTNNKKRKNAMAANI